jgi:pimeloyl-ACP methyl ester carboxylesterase
MRVDIGGGIRLFVDIEGPGLVADGDKMRQKPTLLLLHGGPGFDHSGFKPRFSALADICHIVYYDHRGNGRSDWGDKSLWTLDTWADDVVRLCDVLGIEKPIVLGNSFGGMVVQNYMARHPDHASKVILSSTAGKMDIPAVIEMFRMLGGEDAAQIAKAFWTSPTIDDYDEYIRVCGPLYTATPGNALGSNLAVRNPEVGEHFITGEQRSMNLLPGLKNAKCPALLLAGKLDPVCPPSVMEAVRDALPAELVTYEFFENCGHGVFRDDPERAIEVLRRFILP